MKDYIKTYIKQLALILLLCSGYAHTAMATVGGAGTQDSPFQVYDLNDLKEILSNIAQGNNEYPLDSWITLNSDITFPDNYIGDGSSLIKGYSGTFNGNGHTISNMKLDYDSIAAQEPQGSEVSEEELDRVYVGLGLFASIAESGKVMNLTIENFTIDGFRDGLVNKDNVGIICGINRGTISNCVVRKNKCTGINYIGGICGKNYGTIERCGNETNINNIEVNGSTNIKYIGGICGYNEGTLKGCYNIAEIKAVDNYAGGLAGVNVGTISSCFNMGTVSLSENASGANRRCAQICNWEGYEGEHETYYPGSINYCYGYSEVACPMVSDNIRLIQSNIEKKSADDFSYGMVCWLLNKVTNENEDPIWGLKIDSDTYPHFYVNKGDDCNKIFPNTLSCDGKTPNSFSNADPGANLDIAQHSTHVNGVCPVCHGDYEEAPKNSEGVYELSNAGHLYWFANLIKTGETKYTKAKLTDDITVNENLMDKVNSSLTPDWTWTPIGDTKEKWFYGELDGQGHTISGLFSYNNGKYSGLVGYGRYATIKNIRIADSYLYNDTNNGGICGYADNSTFSDCRNEATLEGGEYIGGICGYAEDCNISKSENHGPVGSLNSKKVGGICGHFNLCVGEKIFIQDCYSTGKIRGNKTVGGLCGLYGEEEIHSNLLSNMCYAVITNCHCQSLVEGTKPSSEYDEPSAIGSLIGTGGLYNFNNSYQRYLILSNCYYLESGLKTVGESSGMSKYFVMSEINSQNSDAFANGSTAWKLNQDRGSITWYQKLGTGGDSYPVLISKGDDIVYQYKNCQDGLIYLNDPNHEDKSHIYNDNGFCNTCDAYEPATINRTDNYYEISNAGQLYSFYTITQTATDKNINVRLVNNIVINNHVLTEEGELDNDTKEGLRQWKPISKDIKSPYTGIFDGQGHSIRGLYCISEELLVYASLFGNIQNATIKDLGIEDSYSESTGVAASLIAGYSKDSKLINCSAQGKVSSKYYAGLICGSASGEITNCIAKGSVYAGSYSGLICGISNGAKITNCYAFGNASTIANTSRCGGICGEIEKQTRIQSCYFSGHSDAYGIGWSDGNLHVYDCCYNSSLHEGEGINQNGCEVYGLTTDEFKSGKATWLLNDAKTEDIAYYQSLDPVNGDAYPVLVSTGNNTVYAAKYQCDGKTANAWTNDQNVVPTTDDHVFDNKLLAEAAGEDGLYHYLCDNNCGAQDGNTGIIKDLNASNQELVLSKDASDKWAADADITLLDAAGTNWYKAPVDFTAKSVSYSRTMSNKWGTICLPFSIKATDFSGKCSFYVLSQWNETAQTLTLTQTTGVINAGTPLLIMREGDNKATIEIKADEAEMHKDIEDGSQADGYSLKGLFTTAKLSAEGEGELTDNDYIISNNKFWNIGDLKGTTGFPGVVCPPFRSYISYNSTSGTMAAPMLNLSVGGATGLEAIDALNGSTTEYYDANGRRQPNLSKGVNIIRNGGRSIKVIVK